MKYTLEIQKLLLQAQNKNLHPREKANLLKEATASLMKTKMWNGQRK